MTYLVEHDRVDGSGFYIRGLAGEDLGNRKVVYINSDGTWKLANGANAATMPSIGITMHETTANKYVWILLKGFIGLSTWTWTIGHALYVSETTSGEITQTAPTDSAEIIQILGYAEATNQIFFSPRQIIGSVNSTYTKTVYIPAEAMGRGAANNPTVVDLGNITLYSFTLNTDFLTYKLPVPSDYANGGLGFNFVWTNDGGADDQGKNAKAQFDYQITTEGDDVSGSHANSPKNVEDAYTSASGNIECRSDYVTIADSDFNTDDCVYVKLSFVTPTPTALTCEPRLVGVCLQYTAYTDPRP